MSSNLGFGLAFAATAALCCVAVYIGGPAKVVMPSVLGAIAGSQLAARHLLAWADERANRINC